MGIYKNYIPYNQGDIKYLPFNQDNIKRHLHWYIEIHDEMGIVSYERTFCNDKKYQGNKGAFYQFIQILEYQVNGIDKRRK